LTIPGLQRTTLGSRFRASEGKLAARSADPEMLRCARDTDLRCITKPYPDKQSG
jgi:hypothetical protein